MNIAEQIESAKTEAEEQYAGVKGTKEVTTTANAEATQSPELLTPETAAPLAGYRNKVSFMRAAKRYGMPFIRINPTRILIRRSDLENWLASLTIVGRQYRSNK